MAQTITSHAGRLPITDGRSAEAQYIRRLRAELRQHVGGAPTIAQRLLIDRVVNIALRLHALDCEPILLENGDYLELTRMLTELLAQLSDQPAPASIVHRPPIHEVAA
jgi:hypothetical protein